MTMPSGRGGWAPKSPRARRILAICVWTAAPIVAAFIVWTAVVGGLR
ncbi:hypothetical protein [Curtobacterium sp. MCSS17_007]|nr:hypothetical protein [Curtobacterium sp. MCSS17_007]WIE75040.1 hypothetical protein DEJ22_012350 [Curtobacterium sp. MCSS17_007]